MSSEFRYFAHPHEFAHFAATPAICEFCGEARPHYSGRFYGSEKGSKNICEACLAGGRLETLNFTLNHGDSGALQRQLSEAHPELSAEEIERIAHERTVELEKRTPARLTWQDLDWPVHCGDYCRYIKEIGQPELVALASDGDGPAYLAAHAPDIEDIEFARDVWGGVRPDAPTDAAQVYSVGVYLFTCLVCGEHVILWDCD